MNSLLRTLVGTLVGTSLGLVLALVLVFALALAVGQQAVAQDASVIIEADGQVAWDKNQALYEAEGNVRITRGMWLLNADRVEAFYEEQKQEDAGRKSLPSARDLKLVHALSQNKTQVIATHQDGTTLSAHTLTWHPQKQRLEAVEGGLIERSDGSFLSAQQELVHQRFDSGKEESRARGNIKIRTPEGDIIQGTQALALGSNGKISEYRVFGSAIVTRTNGETAKAQRLLYLVSDRLIQLQEQVSLVSQGRTLNGDQAEIDLNSGRSVLLPKSGEKIQGIFEPASE